MTRVLPFPAGRARAAPANDPTVVVRFAGETTIYDSPQALAAAFREHDPFAARRLEKIDGYVTRARFLADQAEARERDAAALMRRARAAVAAERSLRTYVRKLKLAAAVGAALAVVAFAVEVAR